MPKTLHLILISFLCITYTNGLYAEQMTGGGYTLQGSFDVITGQGNQGAYTLNPYSDPLTAEGVSSGGTYTIYPTPYIGSVEAVQGQSIAAAVVVASVSYGSEVASIPTSLQTKDGVDAGETSSENGGNTGQYSSSSSSTVELTTGTWYGSRGEEESAGGSFGKRPFVEDDNQSKLLIFSCWFWWLIILIILIRLRQNYKEYKEKHRHK